MAASVASAADTGTSSSSSVSTIPNNLSNFIPCQHTFVATHRKKDFNSDDSSADNTERKFHPRVCRLRTRDNAMAIYALVDPIDTNMLAADVSVNMLVEQLSEISFNDDSYREKINERMQNVFYEIENRLLQMTFDRAEEKLASAPSSVKAAEKLLPALEEAESGAFLFAATVTQSNFYIAYVGNIRVFIISNNNGNLVMSNDRPQYYHTGSLHTIDNEDESRRLTKLDVDLDQMRNANFGKRYSKMTRCIGKLSEKLLSSAASANDVNEARCNPLVCEPKVEKHKIVPQDCALVMMTDKVFQMCMETGLTEEQVPSKFLELLTESINSPNLAQQILDRIEELYQVTHTSEEQVDSQDLGLLIHFFHHPKNANQMTPLVKLNITRRVVDGEVKVDEVKQFIKKSNEMQQKREKNRNSSTNYDHKRENQQHHSTIEPFVRFDVYEKLLSDNEELRQANDFITDLLYNQSTSSLDNKLTEYLKEHPSLLRD